MWRSWWWTAVLTFGFGGCGSGDETSPVDRGRGAALRREASGRAEGESTAGNPRVTDSESAAGGLANGGTGSIPSPARTATDGGRAESSGAGGTFDVGGEDGDPSAGNEAQGSSGSGASGESGLAGGGGSLGLAGGGGATNEVPATCGERGSCRFVAAAACLGEPAVPCQCDAQCAVQGDCCADAAAACADARQDERDLTTALQARDATRVAEIVARDRYDPSTILGSVLRDRERMALLVNAGVPLNRRDRGGSTPLMRSEVNVETARLLLDAGADLEARSGACLTPLMVRIQNSSDIAIPNLLIDRGANVNAVTPNGNTPLLFAITSFWGGPVFKLLEKGADPDARNADGVTPLTASVRHSLPFSVRSLVRFGADLNGTGPEGEPFWVYTLVDNSPVMTRLSAADDELVEWVFSHPELIVDLAAPGASEAIATALTRRHIAHYAAYLQARGEGSPTLSEGTLIDTFEGNEYRLANGRLRKNGLDITPPSFDLSRPLRVIDHWYVFPLDTASLPPGFSNVNGADYTKRFFYYGARYSSWSYSLYALNVRGLTSVTIVPEQHGASVTTQLPRERPIRRDLGMTVYTRPYRR